MARLAERAAARRLREARVSRVRRGADESGGMNPCPRSGVTELERLEAYYEPEPNSGCWLWLENLDNNEAMDQ